MNMSKRQLSVIGYQLSVVLVTFILTNLCLADVNNIAVPVIDSDWRQIAGNPDLGKFNDSNQQPVDFAIWQAADGSWQLWSCIRGTKCGGNTRLFYRWEGKHITDSNWIPMGIAMTAKSEYGEPAGGLQAPHVVKYKNKYWMFYGDWNDICLAVSDDGKVFKRVLDKKKVAALFNEGGMEVNTRDPMLLHAKNKWFCYYTACPDKKGYVFCRTSGDLKKWSSSKIVAFGGSAGQGWASAECPHVVEPVGGNYYLFRTQYYGPGAKTSVYYSKDPLDFGINDDSHFVCKFNMAAPEIVKDGGQYYIAALNLNLDGIRIAKLKWPENKMRKISIKEYRDKMTAGWLGQMVGVAWGYPVEFKYLAQIMPEVNVPKWRPEMINDAFWQDDLYVEMTFLKSIQKYGFDVSYKQAGIDFANTKFDLWHANKFGRDNLRSGIAPPDSGHPKFNSHADDIDYQIEADFAGLISPGLPGFAVELGDKFGRIMNYGDGLYGGYFISAMYSIAFFESDINKIIAGALEYIPAESQYAEAIRDTIKWHSQYPKDWQKTWRLLNKKYQKNPDYRKFSCDKGDFNIDAKISGAFVVMGLLYGNGNIEDTIRIPMQCGQDSDCNPSSAAGILFTKIGYSKLPEKYKSVDMTRKFNHTPYDLPSLFNLCEKLAADAVRRCGGSVGKDEFSIPSYPAQSIKLETSFSPGEIGGSKYTKEEMRLIQPADNKKDK